MSAVMADLLVFEDTRLHYSRQVEPMVLFMQNSDKSIGKIRGGNHERGYVICFLLQNIFQTYHPRRSALVLS